MVQSNVDRALEVIEKLFVEAEALQAESEDTPSERRRDALHLRLAKWAEYAIRQIGKFVSEDEGDEAGTHIGFVKYPPSIYSSQYRHETDIKESIDYLLALQEAIEREPGLVNPSRPEPKRGSSEQPGISESTSEAVRRYQKWRRPIDAAEWLSKVFSTAVTRVKALPDRTLDLILSNRVVQAVTLVAAVVTIAGYPLASAR